MFFTKIWVENMYSVEERGLFGQYLIDVGIHIDLWSLRLLGISGLV